jgi:hypothetical protein
MKAADARTRTSAIGQWSRSIGQILIAMFSLKLIVLVGAKPAAWLFGEWEEGLLL